MCQLSGVCVKMMRDVSNKGECRWGLYCRAVYACVLLFGREGSRMEKGTHLLLCHPHLLCAPRDWRGGGGQSRVRGLGPPFPARRVGTAAVSRCPGGHHLRARPLRLSLLPGYPGGGEGTGPACGPERPLHGRPAIAGRRGVGVGGGRLVVGAGGAGCLGRRGSGCRPTHLDRCLGRRRD